MLCRILLAVAFVSLTTMLSGCSDPSQKWFPDESRPVFMRWGEKLSTTYMLRLKPTGGVANGTEFGVKLPFSTEVTIDGRKATRDQLRPGMRIQLWSRDKRICKVEEYSPEQ
jgi:hypothetical protein